jgi:hypothetical protein
MKPCGLVLPFGEAPCGGNQQIIELAKIASNTLSWMTRIVWGTQEHGLSIDSVVESIHD